MGNVSRPLIGLLVATVAFFALWLIALKPSSSPSGGSQGLGAYQPAINQAKASVASQNAAAAAANATSATSSPAAAASPTTAASPTAAAKSGTNHTTETSPARTAKPAATATAANATASQRLNVVQRALAGHKVLALLIYNPAAADDQAVKKELGTIPTRRGRVVKLAIPVGEITNYPVITNQVPIEASPTLVVVDASGKAFTLVGFADGFEIAQRIDGALSAR